ncbi:flap endonuclease GEN homolog 1 [Epinephelus fuscoguttatus]|uniref:flap endonuclease GEN homolog 1 n=1 Tax=Epinephelus fuscoguttatus TaxID=293821 RepID=UPI0020D0A3D5|nr:flap endonuclease GEN homolog 1 [Epinephelus fuscoguttatus]XP_049445927.1 flap endonuclease GEN homolog 1 [Epinephelus fuscoguttatus]
MGVHELWSIVEPVRESVPLYSLSGKTLAVDLSLWVCEAQHVQAMMGRVTKPHLRNLFFRVSSLTLMGVKLVFVMEGEAPKLKAETMSRRAETRYGGFKKASAPKAATKTSRGRFNAVLRECAEMLDYLGVPWVTAAGEAEAMCAYLDSQGLVDGCITNDGDAFLYGARTVYRNFNMNSKDPQVDCYKTSRVQTELHLTRENLVGLAIFLGCDYIPKGIPGVGKEQALRLIQMLKGQTLLQRFIQWKEENVGVSEGVVKKVPHCNLCRHPGSAKAHERGGCVLCDSKRFCQPQDFDYQCPCDWHRHEQTRQAVSFEANVRRKTLASEQFPFTEIINEFLISKDKPVSHFKRRQPNMLMMQKFAHDKMEWPRHYTSEKVLVLMTYAELMNRKYGREMSSQVKPLRILKPRVRNAVACFEVIWSVPDHYAFPEDRPADDQHEVRTVEEESLFRVAFPEVVENYLRDKALAEENKTKKRKPKSKKEKPSDVSDGISDLLAQMTLQSSSYTQPHVLLPTVSTTDKPEVVVVDTPVNYKQHWKSKEDHSSLGDCPSTPLSHGESEAAAASPSVSAVIDALHLSDIDWEALSFTSSPTPQSANNHTAEPKLSKTTDSGVRETEGENTKQKTSSDVREADSRSALELCYTECPLRDRLLMRNTAKAIHQKEIHTDVVSKQLNHESSSLKYISPHNSSGQIPSKGTGDSKLSGEKSAVYKKEPLTDKTQCTSNKEETHSSKQQLRPAAQSKTKDKCNISQKPPHKYKFVRKAISSSLVPRQRCHSDPSQTDIDRNTSQSTKKSVCMSLRSSSEESDAENRQSGPQRKAKIKPTNKIIISDFPLKPKSTKPAAKTAPTTQLLPAKSQILIADSEINILPVATKSKCQDVSPAHVDVDVFPQTPASPVIVLDSDDSVICGESPLPLAERLRLKFQK